jgi:hypothetical protein
MRTVLAGAWFGALAAVAGLAAPAAGLAAPAAFALLSRADAGRFVGRLLAGEATASLLLGGALLGLERWRAKGAAEAGTGSQFSAGIALAAGAIFCTIAGHHALLPMMDAARAGQGALSFAALHGVSVAFYAVKLVLVGTLAWRAAGGR